MSYKRIYASKNNTVFKKNSGNIAALSGTINTGSSPTMEMMNGNGESALVFAFDISSIKPLLSAHSYTCSLRLWDGGTIFEPSLPPQDIELIYFEQDFLEGNGFSFAGQDVLEEKSNYNFRDATNNWDGILFATKATGSINIVTGFTIGDKFQINGTTLTAGLDFGVGSTDSATANNFVAAIATKVPAVTAVSNYIVATNGNGTISLTANAAGTVGNSITLVIVASTNLHTVSGPTLTGGVDLTAAPSYPLDKTNDDIVIDVSTFIATAITDNANPRFALRPSIHTNDVATFTKFIHSRHTRTVFQPYLEFQIADEIIDERNDVVATIPSKLFLLTQTGINFVGTTVSAEIQDATGTLITTPIVVNPQPGVYFVSYTPDISVAKKNVFDVWKVDGVTVAKNLLQVKSPNAIKLEDTLGGLFFGPTTAYLNANIRKNDIARFVVTSEIRGKGAVISDKYEYRIVATNAFEMVPWTRTNVYNNKIFFDVDTTFFYPEIEYEVFVRLVEDTYIRTSNLTYKFRLQEDGPTHLIGRSASPYSDRNYLFNK